MHAVKNHSELVECLRKIESNETLLKNKYVLDFIKTNDKNEELSNFVFGLEAIFKKGEARKPCSNNLTHPERNGFKNESFYISGVQRINGTLLFMNHLILSEEFDFCENDTTFDANLHNSGCNNFYFACYKNITFRIICPENQFYNLQNDSCEPKENNISACHEPNPITTLSLTTTKETYCKDRNESLSENIKYFGLKGCQDYHFMCILFTTFRIQCDKNSVFNVKTKKCDIKNNFVECRMTAEPIKPKFIGNNNCENRTLNLLRTATWSQEKEGCNDHFFFCIFNLTWKMHCPENTAYNKEMNGCDNVKYIPACQNQQSAVINDRNSTTTTSMPITTQTAIIPTRDPISLSLMKILNDRINSKISN